MTQLVQLQQVAGELSAHGINVFAISNDPVDVLADFAKKHEIGYPLLSDEDSSVIRSFGIMNQLIEPEDGRSMRWYGIPYPGTYFVNTNGVVTDKDFHQHHSWRASGASVLARALGRELDFVEDTIAQASSDEVSVRVGLADPGLQLELITKLIVVVDIPAPNHIYAPGAPDAFTPLTVDVSGDGLRVGEPTWPESTALTMTELELTAPTYAGRVHLEVPIAITSEAVRLGHELAAETVDVKVEVRLQACDDTSCGLPQTLRLTITVPVERLVEPEGLSLYAERVEAIESERGNAVR